MLGKMPIVKYLHVFGGKCFMLEDKSEYVEIIYSNVYEAILLVIHLRENPTKSMYLYKKNHNSHTCYL